MKIRFKLFLGLRCIDRATFLHCWSDCFVQQQRCNPASIGSRKFHWFGSYVDMQYLIYGYLFLSCLPLLQLPGPFINPIEYWPLEISYQIVWHRSEAYTVSIRPWSECLNLTT